MSAKAVTCAALNCSVVAKDSWLPAHGLTSVALLLHRHEILDLISPPSWPGWVLVGLPKRLWLFLAADGGS